MSAYKAIYSLLSNSSAVSALVGTRIYPVTVPEKRDPDDASEVVYPCIAIGIVSERPLTMVGLESNRIVKARAQVTVLAEDYGAKEEVMSAVLGACKSGLAVIDGVRVNGIIALQLGPDFRDESVKLFMQSQDFQVQYNESH